MIQSHEEVLAQSKAAMAQWEDLWRQNCTKNAEIYRTRKERLNDILFKGRGRTCVAVAMGASLEQQVKDIAKWQGKTDFDVLCVDKAVKHLQENGVTPDYVLVADASVSPDWLDGFDSSKSALIANINSQPDWSKNWKGPIYFYVNKDNIESEKIFSQISGCYEQIPAASNVGNAICVVATSVMDYDKIILCGYDFCWGEDDNYYAFTDSDKRYWMNHRIATDRSGRLVNTSENLVFSARWLMDFLNVLPRKVFWVAGEKTILDRIPSLNLDRQLSRASQRQLTESEKQEIVKAVRVPLKPNSEAELQEIIKNCKVIDITVGIIPEETFKWLN